MVRYAILLEMEVGDHRDINAAVYDMRWRFREAGNAMPGYAEKVAIPDGVEDATFEQAAEWAKNGPEADHA